MEANDAKGDSFAFHQAKRDRFISMRENAPRTPFRMRAKAIPMKNLARFLVAALLTYAHATKCWANDDAPLDGRFYNGELRLTKSFFDKSAFGRDELREAYRKGEWVKLVNIVLSRRAAWDTYYFYLGRAAEELGYEKAAITYYGLAINSDQNKKCNGVIDLCDGFVFPQDAQVHLDALTADLEAPGRRASLLNDLKFFLEREELDRARDLLAQLGRDFPESSESTEANALVTAAETKSAEKNRAREGEAKKQTAALKARLARAKAGPSAWRVSKITDEMRDETKEVASAESSNILTFDFPYNGKQRAHLNVRNSGGLFEVFVWLPKAQILCHECTMLVRFDESEATEFAGVGTKDHSTNTVFIDDAYNFVNRMKESRRVRIELSFFQNGKRILDFPVQNFPW